MKISVRDGVLSVNLRNKVLDTRIVFVVPVFFALQATLFFYGAYLYSRGGFGESKLIAPIPLGKQEPTSHQDIIKARVLSVKTIDNYPPNKYFPKNWRPLYGELSESDEGFLPSLTPGDPFPQYQNEVRYGASHVRLGVRVSAEAYLVYDKTGGKILYGKNMLEELPVASLAKIMTAVVTLDNADLNDRFIVPEEALVGEAFMGLSVGESLRVEDLLYGIMLNSGNDAAETLAYGVGGIGGGGGVHNRERFIEMMNEKAQALGMNDTYFVNPTGLDEETVEKSSFSTALDLLALTNYALENEVFREIVDTKRKTVSYEKNKHKTFFLTNKLGLEKAYPAIKGVKPGTTEFAGNTLVSYGELDKPTANSSDKQAGKQEYIIIMLNSPHIRDETIGIYKMLYGE